MLGIAGGVFLGVMAVIVAIAIFNSFSNQSDQAAWVWAIIALVACAIWVLCGGLRRKK